MTDYEFRQEYRGHIAAGYMVIGWIGMFVALVVWRVCV